jgi:hypothetical protein
MVHSWMMRGSVAVSVCPSARNICPLALVSTAALLCHTLPGLLAFFRHPGAVYIRPNGLANPRIVFRMPHRHREGGR